MRSGFGRLLSAAVFGLCYGGTASADPIGTQWPQPDGAGSPVVLTYSYSNLLDGAFLMISPRDIRLATQEALGLWASVAPLHFVERPDYGPPPSDSPYALGEHPILRIGHHPGTVRAHAFFPNPLTGLAGDVHLDTGAPWTIGGEFDLLETLVHEIGHAIGLGHELLQLSIMNPIAARRFNGFGSAFLFRVDVQNVQSIYGWGEGSVTPIPEPATLLLVAAGALAGRFAQRHRGASRK